MRIGFMGGTFNPIHLGHIQMALKAKNEFDLDKMILIPSGFSYMKKNVLDANTRFKMTELAAKEYDMEVTDIERKKNKPSYSWETMQSLSEQYPEDELFFLMGEDSLNDVEYWNHPERLFELSTIIVAARKAHHNKESLQVCIKKLQIKYNAKILAMEFDNPVSSTEIRESYRTNQPLIQYLPNSVVQYINEKHLYQI